MKMVIERFGKDNSMKFKPLKSRLLALKRGVVVDGFNFLVTGVRIPTLGRVWENNLTAAKRIMLPSTR